MKTTTGFHLKPLDWIRITISRHNPNPCIFFPIVLYQSTNKNRCLISICTLKFHKFVEGMHSRASTNKPFYVYNQWKIHDHIIPAQKKHILIGLIFFFYFFIFYIFFPIQINRTNQFQLFGDMNKLPLGYPYLMA